MNSYQFFVNYYGQILIAHCSSFVLTTTYTKYEKNKSNSNLKAKKNLVGPTDVILVQQGHTRKTFDLAVGMSLSASLFIYETHN